MGLFAKAKNTKYNGSATICAALIMKATLLTVSSCVSNDLCGLLSCHLLKYIVHKPVSKAQPTAQNTFVEMWIVGVGELSTLVFRTSQQLYYFIWTDLREHGLNRKALSIKSNTVSTSWQAAWIHPLSVCLNRTGGSTQPARCWTMIQENTFTCLKKTTPWCQHKHF